MHACVFKMLSMFDRYLPMITSFFSFDAAQHAYKPQLVVAYSYYMFRVPSTSAMMLQVMTSITVGWKASYYSTYWGVVDCVRTHYVRGRV